MSSTTKTTGEIEILTKRGLCRQALQEIDIALQSAKTGGTHVRPR